MIKKIFCPVCNSNKINLVRDLTSAYLVEELGKYFNKKSLNKKDVLNYRWFVCSHCELEFCSPLIAGNKTFYNYVCDEKKYYCDNRWEWNVVINFIKHGAETQKILDVGCGNGEFLNKCTEKFNDKIECFGLDTLKSSVDKCLDKDLDVYLGTISQFKKKYPRKKYDVVTSFHCLEHVEDPIKFMSDLKSLLMPNGVLYVSTPYNSLPKEKWFEIMNFPPHHMTGWRQNTYRYIAKKIGLDVKFYMPKTNNLKYRIINSLYYFWYGANLNNPSFVSNILNFLKSPSAFFEIVFNQISREKIFANFENNGNLDAKKDTVNYVILGEFKITK